MSEEKTKKEYLQEMDLIEEDNKSKISHMNGVMITINSLEREMEKLRASTIIKKGRSYIPPHKLSPLVNETLDGYRGNIRSKIYEAGVVAADLEKKKAFLSKMSGGGVPKSIASPGTPPPSYIDQYKDWNDEWVGYGERTRLGEAGPKGSIHSLREEEGLSKIAKSSIATAVMPLGSSSGTAVGVGTFFRFAGQLDQSNDGILNRAQIMDEKERYLLERWNGLRTRNANNIIEIGAILSQESNENILIEEDGLRELDIAWSELNDSAKSLLFEFINEHPNIKDRATFRDKDEREAVAEAAKKIRVAKTIPELDDAYAELRSAAMGNAELETIIAPATLMRDGLAQIIYWKERLAPRLAMVNDPSGAWGLSPGKMQDIPQADSARAKLTLKTRSSSDSRAAIAQNLLSAAGEGALARGQFAVGGAALLGTVFVPAINPADYGKHAQEALKAYETYDKIFLDYNDKGRSHPLVKYEKNYLLQMMEKSQQKMGDNLAAMIDTNSFPPQAGYIQSEKKKDIYDNREALKKAKTVEEVSTILRNLEIIAGKDPVLRLMISDVFQAKEALLANAAAQEFIVKEKGPSGPRKLEEKKGPFGPRKLEEKKGPAGPLDISHKGEPNVLGHPQFLLGGNGILANSEASVNGNAASSTSGNVLGSPQFLLGGSSRLPNGEININGNAGFLTSGNVLGHPQFLPLAQAKIDGEKGSSPTPMPSPSSGYPNGGMSMPPSSSAVFHMPITIHAPGVGTEEVAQQIVREVGSALDLMIARKRAEATSSLHD